MLDFAKMNPIDFEEFVAETFRKLGFRTQLTQSTGDGGIDIIAQYDGSVFQGTYLIQCKHWSKNVGEPPIRDLYGVVQSENALKGVVVASSNFSPKAVEFCKGKNLELINGDTLRKLYTEDIEINDGKNQVYSDQARGFLAYPDFPKRKYSILTTQVEKKPKLKDSYKVLFELLLEQMLLMKYEVRSNGLLEELFYYANRYKEVFTKKRDNESRGDKIAINYILAILNFIKGDLVSVYELLVDLKDGYQFKTNWTVKDWWGLTERFKKVNCPCLFYSLLVTIDPLKEEIEKQPVIHYLTNFNYLQRTSYLSTILVEEKELTLVEFLDTFKIKDIDGFEEQLSILKEIINEELYYDNYSYND